MLFLNNTPLSLFNLRFSGLQHPNIVSLRGICLKPFCLVAEYLTNLFTLIIMLLVIYFDEI